MVNCRTGIVVYVSDSITPVLNQPQVLKSINLLVVFLSSLLVWQLCKVFTHWRWVSSQGFGLTMMPSMLGYYSGTLSYHHSITMTAFFRVPSSYLYNLTGLIPGGTQTVNLWNSNSFEKDVYPVTTLQVKVFAWLPGLGRPLAPWWPKWLNLGGLSQWHRLRGRKKFECSQQESNLWPSGY